jgi:RNA polymerase sigma-70 factor, ECF subfamily
MASLILSGWNWLGKGRGLFASQGRSQASSRSHAADRLAAFEHMVATDWDRFHRYALRLCQGSVDDAEDLLSESMLDAFRAFDSYRGDGFDRWFFRMITNNRIDMVRRAKVRQAESLDTAFAGEEGELHGREIADEAKHEPEHQILDPMYSEPIEKALDVLPEEFRSVVLLCDVEQMDYQEIADTLGVPIGTVRSRIHRGRHQLRKTLENSGWKPGD